MLRIILLGFLSSLLFLSCASEDKKADTAEGAFKLAQDYEKEDRYEEAIKRFQEVRNKFPYSKFAILAELAIADTYYKEESFIEAQISYQNFKDLHPKHAQIDYVTFRLAMSYYSQLPSTIDRDLSLAQSAILYFNELINHFPQSSYYKESLENKEKTLRMLAEKEEYIADFYFKKEKYDSALKRYKELNSSKYSQLGFGAKALSRSAICYAKLGEYEDAKKTWIELKAKFPSSLNEIQEVGRFIK